MGVQAQAFWPLVSVAAGFVVAGAGFAALRRPHLFFVAQFSAAVLVLDAGQEAGLFPVVLAGAALFAPLAVILIRAVRHRAAGTVLAVVLAVAGGGLLDAGLRRAADPGLVPRRRVGDVWDPRYPLRVRRPPVMLKPRLRHGRLFTHGGEIRFDWPTLAGREEAPVLLENAGPVEEYRVMEGDAELTAGQRSRMLVRCRFPRAGGSVRLEPRAWPGGRPTRVLALTGGRGRLGAVARLLEEAARPVPDVVVLLGDLAARDDYATHLALRDLVDGLGRRVVCVPGPDDGTEAGRRLFRAVWGPPVGVRQAAGVAGVVLDTARLEDLRSTGIAVGFPARMATEFGLGMGLVHAALAAPPGRAADLDLAPEERGQLVDLLRSWNVEAALGTARGPGFSVKEDGFHHLVVGRPGDHLEALSLVVRDGRVVATDVHRVPLEGGVLEGLATAWWRTRAVAEEHPEVGRTMAAGLVGLLTGLSLLLARLRPAAGGEVRGSPGREEEKAAAGATSSSPSAPCAGGGAGSTS